MTRKKKIAYLLFIQIILSVNDANAQALKEPLLDKAMTKGLLQNSNDLFLINLQIGDLRNEIEYIRKKYNLKYDVTKNKLKPFDNQISPRRNPTDVMAGFEKLKSDSDFLKGLIQQSEDIAFLSDQVGDFRKQFEGIKKKYNLLTISTPNKQLPIAEQAVTKRESEIDEVIIIEGLINQLNEIALLSEQIADLRLELKTQEFILSQNIPSPSKTSSNSTFAWSLFGKSLILPGWGHLNANASWKKYLYGSLFLASSYFAFTKYTDFEEAGENYSDPSISFLLLNNNQLLSSYLYSSQTRNDLVQASREANDAIGLVALIYIIGAIDAGFAKQKTNDSGGFRINSSIERYSFNDKNVLMSAEYTWRL